MEHSCIRPRCVEKRFGVRVIEESSLQVDREKYMLQKLLHGGAIVGRQYQHLVQQVQRQILFVLKNARNAALLAKGAEIQVALDGWHKAEAGKPFDPEAYKAFLTEIGYLVPEGPDFEIETATMSIPRSGATCEPFVKCLLPGERLEDPRNKAAANT